MEGLSAERTESAKYVACMLLMWGQIDYKVDGSEGLMTHDTGAKCPSAL